MLTVAGIGPGNPKYLTVDVKEKIETTKYVLGFGRVASSLKEIRPNIVSVNKVDEILNYIEEDKDILLLASGDPNFFGIVDFLKRKEIRIDEVLPGISSFQYMMSKLQKSWQNANFLSLHGRSDSLEKVKEYKTSIILIDKDNTPSFISKELLATQFLTA